MATSAATRLGLYTGFSLYPSTDEPRHIDLSTGRAFTRQVVSDDLSWLLGLNAVREGDSGMDLERVFRAHDQVLKRYNESRGAAETSTLFTPGRSCIVHSILERNDWEAFQQAYEPRNTPQFNALQLSSTLSNSWRNFVCERQISAHEIKMVGARSLLGTPSAPQRVPSKEASGLRNTNDC